MFSQPFAKIKSRVAHESLLDSRVARLLYLSKHLL
jgi:hypothetical protein